MSSPARNFVFTVFFPDAASAAVSIAALPPDVKFMTWQTERCPTTLRVHWQGYVEFSKAMRVAGAKKLHPLFASAHFEKRRGSQQQAIDYCRKEETRIDGPWTLGVPAQQGKDTAVNKDVVAEYILENPDVTESELLRMFPGFMLMNGAKVKEFVFNAKKPKLGDSNFVPRPWQQYILDICATEPDDRTVYWITDTLGNKGKSRLCYNLVVEHNALCLSGQKQNMAYLFKHTLPRIVVFDIDRAAAEYSNHLYSMAETLKNGFICSTKYECEAFAFKPPHVFIFANKTWNRELFSHDRVKEIDLNAPLEFPAPAPAPAAPEVPASPDFEAMIAAIPDDSFW